MRYNRIEQYFTDEDRAFFHETDDYAELNKRHSEIEQRYFNSFGGDISKIKDEALFLIGELEHQDLLDYLDELKRAQDEEIEKVRDYKPALADEITPSQSFYEPNYQRAWEFISYEVTNLVLLIAREGTKSAEREKTGVAAVKEITAAVDAKAAQWYTKEGQTKNYFPILRTRPTSAISLLSGADITYTDPVTKSVTYTRDEVKIVIQNIEKAANQININIDKMLSSALAAFYKLDHSETSDIKTVGLNFSEYARARGYDIDNPDAKKAKNIRDRARKEINLDLKRLTGMVVSWSEKTDKGHTNYSNTVLVQKSEIKDDRIKITFSDDFATFLRQARLVTQYPTKLLGISAKDPNTYKIGKKLIEQYSQYNNWEKGTCDIISVKNLLKVSELQSYEELKAKQNRNWDRLIKTPFETALENLVKIGLLDGWRYCHEKKVLLSDDEAAHIYDNYDNFENLYILFDPAEKLDYAERLARRAEEKERAAAGKKQTAKKRPKKN